MGGPYDTLRTFSPLDFLSAVQTVADSSVSSRLPEQVQRISVKDRDFTSPWGNCNEVIGVSFPFFVYMIIQVIWQYLSKPVCPSS